MKKKMILTSLSLLVLLMVFSLTGCKKENTVKNDQLLIYHFWTAGGEKEAVEALYHIMKTDYVEQLQIVENKVSGGGGADMAAVIMSNLQAGNAPDIIQGHQGSDQLRYIQPGYVDNVNHLWQETDMEKRINPAFIKALKFDGNYYSMPINAHRYWLWFNTKILKEAGINEAPKNYETLLSACKKITALDADISPLALGTKGAEKLWATYLWDLLIILTAGVDYYYQAATGLVDFKTDPVFKKVMLRYAELIPYIYPYHASKSWDEAGALLTNNEAAMYFMGDWILGYYLNLGLEVGRDFDAVAIPRDLWFGHADAFHMAKAAPHKEIAQSFMKMVASPKAQKEFNLIKGSVALVNDVPASVYPDKLRQQSARDITSLQAAFGGFHGGVYCAGFASDLSDILSQFLTDSNVSSAIKEIDKAARRNKLKESMLWLSSQL